MTKTIAELAEENFHAGERFQMLGMQNIAGMDYDQRKASAIAYAEAALAAAEAKRALDRAIETGDFPKAENRK